MIMLGGSQGPSIASKELKVSEPQKPLVPVEKKMVKIQLMQDCMVNNAVQLKGAVVLVDEDRAKQLCDRKFPGYAPFYGYKPSFEGLMEGDPLAEKKIVRAIRVA